MSNTPNPKPVNAYDPDSTGFAERSREHRVTIGGTLFVSSGDMPTIYRTPEE